MLDSAAETERVASRMVPRVRMAVIVILVGAAGLGVAYGVKSVLDRRRAGPPVVAEVHDEASRAERH